MIYACPQVNDRRVTGIGGLELLHGAHHGLNRPPSRPCQEVAAVLVDRVALAGEVATDETVVYVDLLQRKPERRRDLRLQQVRRLVGRNEVSSSTRLRR